MSNDLLRILYRYQMVQRLGENILAYKEARRIKNTKFWLVWSLQKKWQKKTRRRGQTRLEIYRKKIQAQLAYSTMMVYDQRCAEAVVIVSKFLNNTTGVLCLRQSQRSTYRRLVYIQKRIRSNLQTRHSKVDVLLNYWQKLERQVLQRAIEFRDDNTKRWLA